MFINFLSFLNVQARQIMFCNHRIRMTQHLSNIVFGKVKKGD